MIQSGTGFRRHQPPAQAMHFKEAAMNQKDLQNIAEEARLIIALSKTPEVMKRKIRDLPLVGQLEQVERDQLVHDLIYTSKYSATVRQ